MLRQILVGLMAGVAFLLLDGVLNANPMAQRLYAAYQPIARQSVNALAGSAINLAFGVLLSRIVQHASNEPAGSHQGCEGPVLRPDRVVPAGVHARRRSTGHRRRRIP